MCNPLAIGAGLMLAGTAANYRGQKKADNAIKASRAAEKDRQAGFKQQAETSFAENQDALDFDNVSQSMASKAAAREGAYQAVNAAAPRAAEQAAAGSMGGNSVVAGNLADALGRASGRVTKAGQARAQLGSFGDAMFDAGLLTRRGREGISLAGDFASGSQRASEWELNAAQRRGDNAKMIGSLLTAIGGGVMGGAGAAAGGAGAAAGGAGAAGAGAGAAGAGTAAAGSQFAWPWLASGALSGLSQQPQPRGSFIGPR